MVWTVLLLPRLVKVMCLVVGVLIDVTYRKDNTNRSDLLWVSTGGGTVIKRQKTDAFIAYAVRWVQYFSAYIYKYIL